MADNQNSNLKPCAHCGQMMAKSAKACPSCGGKNKPPIYKRPWFIAVMVIIVLGAIGSAGGGNTSSTTNGGNVSDAVVNNAQQTEETIEYTHYDVTEMMADLNSNAMKAQNKYKGQYIEITGKLNVIDSDGKYLSLVDANDQWAILGVQCNIKTDEQRNKVMDMNIGDTITLRGKCTDCGEILGYYLDIESID